MKKFFALALAVAMVMSMAAVSMAAEVTLTGPFDYSADSNKMTAANGFTKDPATGKMVGALLTYGDTVYYTLFIGENGSFYPVSDYALIEKLKVKVSYEMGEDLVENVSIVKKQAQNGYQYFVAFKTASKATTADADVIGTLEFSRKEVKKDDAPKNVADKVLLEKIDDVEVDFAFNLFYENSWLSGAKREMLIDSDEAALKWDTNYALKFENDEEVEFTFGTEENEGSFTVDVSGQGKVFLKYDTKADEAIAAANPGVKMHFVNFNGAKFNRTGEFMYEMEDGVAAYKVVDGALVEIPGVEYDAADEAFYFNTRVLESYVFADAELVNPVVEAPVVEAPAVTNPTTGA